MHSPYVVKFRRAAPSPPSAMLLNGLLFAGCTANRYRAHLTCQAEATKGREMLKQTETLAKMLEGKVRAVFLVIL